MVDGTIAAYGSSSFSYQAQISGAQTTSVALAEQASVAVIANSGGTVFAAAVTINVAASTASANGPVAGQAQDGAQALATLKQTAAEARGFLKKDAQQKLQIAEGELRLLKLLGGGAAGAKQAAQLARQIADAATQYAEGSDPNAPADAAPAESAAAASAQPSTQPSFYEQVDAALATLRKYLQSVAPALKTAPDQRTRAAGETAEEAFDQAEAQAAAAEAAFAGQAGAAAYQPVNLSV
jgi:hypothetical protein